MWFLSGGFGYEVFYSDETRSIAGLEKKATNQKNLGCGLYDLQGRVEGGSSDESCLSQTVDPEVDRHERWWWPTDEKRLTTHYHLCWPLVLLGSARRSVLGKAEGFLHDSRVLIGAFLSCRRHLSTAIWHNIADLPLRPHRRWVHFQSTTSWNSR